MAYFNKIKKFTYTKGVEENSLARDLGTMALYHLVLFSKYKKDYFQIIEVEKLENNILKMTIRQEKVNEEIKEKKSVILFDDIEKELLDNFTIEKMYLIEDEECDGVTPQTLLFPEEY